VGLACRACRKVLRVLSTRCISYVEMAQEQGIESSQEKKSLVTNNNCVSGGICLQFKEFMWRGATSGWAGRPYMAAILARLRAAAVSRNPAARGAGSSTSTWRLTPRGKNATWDDECASPRRGPDPHVSVLRGTFPAVPVLGPSCSRAGRAVRCMWCCMR
jgi:hypothetical protein